MPDQRLVGWARDPDDGPAVLGLDHVLLSMPKGGEDAARTFYCGLLGLSEIEKPPPLDSHGGCWFLGHGILPGLASGVSIHLGVDEPFVPARKAHVALVIDDLPGLRTLFVDAGVEVKDDDADIGIRRFYAFDPFGNRLELIDVRDQGFSASERWTSFHEAGDPPEGTFVTEATMTLDADRDPAAIGAAVTVALCGHWEHDGACRWPHHTAVVVSTVRRTVTRTVVTAGSDLVEVERRIEKALRAGTGPGIQGTWSLLEVARAPLRPDEVELATRIGSYDRHWQMPDE